MDSLKETTITSVNAYQMNYIKLTLGGMLKQTMGLIKRLTTVPVKVNDVMMGLDRPALHGVESRSIVNNVFSQNISVVTDGLFQSSPTCKCSSSWSCVGV